MGRKQRNLAAVQVVVLVRQFVLQSWIVGQRFNVIRNYKRQKLRLKIFEGQVTVLFYRNKLADHRPMPSRGWLNRRSATPSGRVSSAKSLDGHHTIDLPSGSLGHCGRSLFRP